MTRGVSPALGVQSEFMEAFRAQDILIMSHRPDRDVGRDVATLRWRAGLRGRAPSRRPEEVCIGWFEDDRSIAVDAAADPYSVGVSAVHL